MIRKVAPPEVAAALTPEAFEEEFDRLVDALGRGTENEGCVECSGCSGCMGCTFCRDSERLCRCHYCVRCVACTECSHCRDSRTLIGCSHCIETESSVRSSYLVRCVAMSDCSYCFGCVGLSRKDFHILNRPYDRGTYFAITARLTEAFGLGRA